MILNNVILLILFFLPLSLKLNSQVNQEWVARYNGPGNDSDYANSVAVDGSGNVYVTGFSRGSGTLFDYATIKYNSSGVQQWVTRYNGPGNGNDYAYSIAVDGSENVFVTGSSYGIDDDYATIKYNSSGIQQWVARYSGPGNSTDWANSLVIDNSGNVYVTGRSYVTLNNSDYATIKYDSSGIQQWVARYNGPGNNFDFATSLVVDVSGNVYVTGGSGGSGGNDYDYATIKYNSLGVQQWVARYNGPGSPFTYATDIAYSLAVDDSGNVYVTGLSVGVLSGLDYATVKYNSSGVQQWVRRYNGTGNGDDVAYSIAVDASGNVYVAGFSGGSGTAWDYATIKYNSSGVLQWVTRYNGPGNSNDEAHSLAVDNSGNVYVTGYSRSSGANGSEDYATVKYDSSGIQQWVARYNGPGNNYDFATSLVLDVSGNVYITGRSPGSGTNYDYATVKYSQSVGIQPISNEIPKEYRAYQNYPNPFNSSTKFVVQIAELGKVRIIIYDILGRELEVLLNEELKPGSYEIQWDASKYPSGMYFYRIITGDFVDTKKIVLLK